MQLQRFPLLLALPLVISLSACIFPTQLPDEEPFKDEKLAFIEIGKTTKEEIATAMSDFPMKTDEGEVRVKLTPQKYRGGDWWLYAQTREELVWVVLAGTDAEVIGDVDYRFLLIKFDNNGIVAGYELSSSEGYGCNRYGVCVRWPRYTLLAPEDEDRVVKQFDIPADRCGIYVYGGGPIWLDGHRVGWILDKKQFFFWQLDQGVHQLASSLSPDFADQRQDVAFSSIEFSCAAGDLYFFELKTKSSGFFTKRYRVWIEIEQPDAVTGRKAIAKRRLTLDYEERMARIPPPPELAPLIAAAFRGDTEEMRSLIEQGADANASDRHGKTALHYAVEHGQTDIMQWLISNGADANVPDRKGNTALHIASDYGSQSAVKILLPMIHDLNTGNEWGSTALHYAAAYGHIEVMQLLISNGADVNQQSTFGRTPLHAAAQFPDTAPAKLLLAAGADPDIRDADGLLPIDLAKQRQNERVSRFLNTLTHQN